MIEIIMLWKLSANIGKVATVKGLTKLPYQIMIILLWILGEILGFLFVNIFFPNSDSWLLEYGLALVGAIMGALLAFGIMTLIPSQETISSSMYLNGKPEISKMEVFRRSIWVPVSIIFITVSCMCLIIGGPSFVRMKMVQQIDAYNPMTGTEIGADGAITAPKTEFSSTGEKVYFSFLLNAPGYVDLPITFTGYINDQIAFEITRDFSAGIVTIELGEEFRRSRHNVGNYEIIVHYGELYLTSATFSIK